MPSASSCFLHVFDSQKIHIKRSPNMIKIYGDFFWNICDFWDLESTQTEAQGKQHPPHHGQGPMRGHVGVASLVRRLGLYFGRKKAYIRKKIMLKSQHNRSYGSLDI